MQTTVSFNHEWNFFLMSLTFIFKQFAEQADNSVDCLFFVFNPIPTSQGRNQPLYECHVTKPGRNRVKRWLL